MALRSLRWRSGKSPQIWHAKDGTGMCSASAPSPGRTSKPRTTCFPVGDSRRLANRAVIASAVVVQLEEKAPLEPVTTRELETAVANDPQDAALLVATGWDRSWGRSGFVRTGARISFLRRWTGW